MGTDGFRISSLKQQPLKQEKISRTEGIREEPDGIRTGGGRSAHQILMMSSLSSRFRLIFEWSVAAILQQQAGAISGATHQH
jgi:hypothetical protein